MEMLLLDEASTWLPGEEGTQQRGKKLTTNSSNTRRDSAFSIGKEPPQFAITASLSPPPLTSRRTSAPAARSSSVSASRRPSWTPPYHYDSSSSTHSLVSPPRRVVMLQQQERVNQAQQLGRRRSLAETIVSADADGGAEATTAPPSSVLKWWRVKLRLMCVAPEEENRVISRWRRERFLKKNAGAAAAPEPSTPATDATAEPNSNPGRPATRTSKTEAGFRRQVRIASNWWREHRDAARNRHAEGTVEWHRSRGPRSSSPLDGSNEETVTPHLNIEESDTAAITNEASVPSQEDSVRLSRLTNTTEAGSQGPIGERPMDDAGLEVTEIPLLSRTGPNPMFPTGFLAGEARPISSGPASPEPTSPTRRSVVEPSPLPPVPNTTGVCYCDDCENLERPPLASSEPLPRSRAQSVSPASTERIEWDSNTQWLPAAYWGEGVEAASAGSLESGQARDDSPTIPVARAMNETIGVCEALDEGPPTPREIERATSLDEGNAEQSSTEGEGSVPMPPPNSLDNNTAEGREEILRDTAMALTSVDRRESEATVSPMSPRTPFPESSQYINAPYHRAVRLSEIPEDLPEVNASDFPTIPTSSPKRSPAQLASQEEEMPQQAPAA